MLTYILVSTLPMATSVLAHLSRRARTTALLIVMATLAVAFLASGRAFPEIQVAEIELSFDPFSRLAYTAFLMLAALTLVYGWLAREGDNLPAVGLAITGFVGLALSLSKDLLSAGLVFGFGALIAAFGLGLHQSRGGTGSPAMRYVSSLITAVACLVGALSLATRFEVTRQPAVEHITFALLSIFLLIVLGAFPFGLWLPKTLGRGQLMMIALATSALGVGGAWLFVSAYASFPWLMLDQRPILVLMTVAALGTLATSLMAATSKRADHLIGYSAATNAGMVAVGIAAGTPLGIVGGLFALLNYLWATVLMLMCLEISGRNQIEGEPVSRFRRTPATLLGLCAGGLTLAGAPPTGGFVGKWMIYEASAMQSSYLALILIASSALILLAHARFLRGVLLNSPPGEVQGQGDVGRAALVVLLAILTLVVGIYPTPILQTIAEAIVELPLL